jgi:hypothetical protein
MTERGVRPESQERPRPPRHRRRDHAAPPPICYPEIDKGQTRAEHNAHIISLNAERERRHSQAPPTQAESIPDPLAERHKRELADLDKAEALARATLKKRLSAPPPQASPPSERAPAREAPAQEERQGGFFGRLGGVVSRWVGKKGGKTETASVAPLNEPPPPPRRQQPPIDPETLRQRFNEEWAVKRQTASERMAKEEKLARGPIIDPTEQCERFKARARENGGRSIADDRETR